MSKPYTELRVGERAVHLMHDKLVSTCERCGETKSMSEFGFRVMDQNAPVLVIRRQPQCTACRCKAPVKSGRKQLKLFRGI